MSVDQALIALVDRDDILAVKHENIQNEIRKSIAENGNAPKPQKLSEVEKFKDLQSIHNQIKKYYAKIKTNEGTIGFWKMSGQK